MRRSVADLKALRNQITTLCIPTIVVVLAKRFAGHSERFCFENKQKITFKKFSFLPTGEDYKGLRALLFSLLGLTALAPILHFSLSPGLPIDDEAFWAYLCRMFSMGGCYLVGAALYGASLPERCCPGKLDYIGNAHSIFHVLVLVGIVLTWRAVNVLFEVVEEGDFGDICVGFDASAAGSASVALGGRVQ